MHILRAERHAEIVGMNLMNLSDLNFRHLRVVS